jgi:hypothetical protein
MSRELLQQALPLLEKSYPTLARKLCDEIHEFLAAQPAPAEPVAWRWRQRPHESKAWGDWFVNLNTPPRQKTSDTFEVEPLCVAAQPAPAVDDLQDIAQRIQDGQMTNGHFSHRDLVMCSKAHYAAILDAAQPAPVPVPLTDEQIDALYINGTKHWIGKRHIARAIEAAHGIAASPEKL